MQESTKPRYKFIIIPLVASLLFVLFGALFFKPEYITITQAMTEPSKYLNEQIRVRGWTDFVVEQTLLECDPPSCDCNLSSGRLYLSDERVESSEILSSSSNRLLISGVDCDGDECGLTCKPFDPRSDKAYEFVGTLKSEPLRLDEIDFNSSSRLLWGWNLRYIIPVHIPILENIRSPKCNSA